MLHSRSELSPPLQWDWYTKIGPLPIPLKILDEAWRVVPKSENNYDYKILYYNYNYIYLYIM